ncbi:hypothetical protein PIB30_029781 [Stylosanthes scabra]|uniref:Uncharacterized protein n=1 Tax=Stylosanthes scabra TaxID=79078 RepID=A0ABU6SBZ3_9FABA|nr:hypothetical protein [Stylosanthes scabra]
MNTIVLSRVVHGSGQIRRSDTIRRGFGSDWIRSTVFEDRIADLLKTSAYPIGGSANPRSQKGEVQPLSLTSLFHFHSFTLFCRSQISISRSLNHQNSNTVLPSPTRPPAHHQYAIARPSLNLSFLLCHSPVRRRPSFTALRAIQFSSIVECLILSTCRRVVLLIAARRFGYVIIGIIVGDSNGGYPSMITYMLFYMLFYISSCSVVAGSPPSPFW